MSERMRAYIVHDGDPGEGAVLVFAATARQARVMGFGVNDLGCESFLDMRAEWLREGAEYHHKLDGPHVVDCPKSCVDCDHWWASGLDETGRCETCAAEQALDAEREERGG